MLLRSWIKLYDKMLPFAHKLSAAAPENDPNGNNTQAVSPPLCQEQLSPVISNRHRFSPE